MKSKGKKGKPISVRAHEITQGNWKLYCFVLPAATLDHIAFVSRREEDKELGYQRNLSKARAVDIARYLDNEGGCIPNSILINLESGAKYKNGKLTIPNEERAAWVIDGQHRMYGLRQSKAKFPVVVTAFLGLDVETQAKQFKVINSNQRGVPTSLLYDLLDLTKDGTSVEQRGHDLAKMLQNEPESPWYQQIDMTGSGNGLITQTRVVTALEGLISERGALFQYTLEEQYGILKNYFAATKLLLPAEWGSPKSVLTKAMGFSAFLIILPQVLTSTLQRKKDFTIKSAAQILAPVAKYDFSSERHKGWAGHPGENRLAEALAAKLKGNNDDVAPSEKIRLV